MNVPGPPNLSIMCSSGSPGIGVSGVSDATLYSSPPGTTRYTHICAAPPSKAAARYVLRSISEASSSASATAAISGFFSRVIVRVVSTTVPPSDRGRRPEFLLPATDQPPVCIPSIHGLLLITKVNFAARPIRLVRVDHAEAVDLHDFRVGRQRLGPRPEYRILSAHPACHASVPLVMWHHEANGTTFSTENATENGTENAWENTWEERGCRAGSSHQGTGKTGAARG